MTENSNKEKIILDLCGGTGAWSKPYTDNGYTVYNITLPYFDILKTRMDMNDMLVFSGKSQLCIYPEKVYGILAAPPCTEFAGSGARWWKKKGLKPYWDGLSIVYICMMIILTCNPNFWALENPVGRLIYTLGKPIHYFNPCDYGDPYTKKTCLWGKFNIPMINPVEPAGKNPIWYMPPGEDRAMLRSITPQGFAKAFYEANQ